MQAILAARRAQIEAERAAGDRAAGVLPDPTPVAADRVDTLPAPREPEPPPPASPPPPPPPEQRVAPEAPRVHRIVVRGQQIDISEQDMVRAAQHAVEQEALRREAALLAQQQPPPPPPPQQPVLDRSRLVEHVKALQYGDEETAAEALSQLSMEIARQVAPAPAPPPQQVDPNWIADQVYQRVNNVQTLQSALDRFQADYQDIVSDQEATELAAIKADKLRNEYNQRGEFRTVEQIMREAADSVRATKARWGGPASGTAPTANPPAQPAPAPALAANGGRVAIKRATPQAPAASSAPQPADTPTLRSGVTGAQTVEWMRRTRGQPVYR